jgi:hypothetical protein
MEVLQQEREFNDMRRMLYPNPLFSLESISEFIDSRVCAFEFRLVTCPPGILSRNVLVVGIVAIVDL